MQQRLFSESIFAIDFSEVLKHHLINSLVVLRLCRIGLDLQLFAIWMTSTPQFAFFNHLFYTYRIQTIIIDAFNAYKNCRQFQARKSHNMNRNC